MPKPALALIASLALLPLAGCATSSPPPGAEPHAQPAPEQEAPAQPFFTGEPRWRPIYQGIDHAELATDTPRYLVVQVLRIDTTAEGLELFTTPGNGDEPLDTDGQTTRAFLEEHGLSVAINTHFFDPCCNRIPGEAKDLIGLSIAQGEMVSPHVDQGQRDLMLFTPLDDEELDMHFWVYGHPQAAGWESNEDAEDLLLVSHALAGRLVLHRGRVLADEGTFSTDRQPRTLVGADPLDGVFYLVTIDGRQPAFSMGATLAEAAGIMHHLGAIDALNVDGGGSTTMVMRDPDGASQLLNSPSGGSERVVGSNLGLRALPLEPVAPRDP